jgi:hypothetical protein
MPSNRSVSSGPISLNTAGEQDFATSSPNSRASSRSRSLSLVNAVTHCSASAQRFRNAPLSASGCRMERLSVLSACSVIVCSGGGTTQVIEAGTWYTVRFEVRARSRCGSEAYGRALLHACRVAGQGGLRTRIRTHLARGAGKRLSRGESRGHWHADSKPRRSAAIRFLRAVAVARRHAASPLRPVRTASARKASNSVRNGHAWCIPRRVEHSLTFRLAHEQTHTRSALHKQSPLFTASLIRRRLQGFAQEVSLRADVFRDPRTRKRGSNQCCVRNMLT